MSYRLGVDTGGTFTDFILVDESDWSYLVHKTPSMPEDPAASFEVGLRAIAESLELDPSDFVGDISLIVHGTTVATNAVLTARGAKVGLVTTAGFRDALQMRRGMREEVLNNKLAAPQPLVPRFLRLGVGERVTFDGSILVPLSTTDVFSAAKTLRAEAIDAVAVCFLHSYANAVHEDETASLLTAELPDVYVTTSHELLAQIRLYDRVSSTVLNAFTGPLIRRYLERLVESLGSLGFGGTLLIMQSNGGVTTPSIARTRAAATLLSGPAAVPLAAARYAEAAGFPDCISVDMGGTSFDAALVPGGKPALLAGGGWINRQRVALPMLAIHTIGAGGGSIGWIDGSGFLRMGPESAGASPGPACYGRGGELPTCTDANLVLGYLNPANFLGGRMTLDSDAAHAAIEAHVAGPLGIDVEEAAAAMFLVINVNMTAGIREVSVDQGVDPRDFLLVVAGGAGPIHAGLIAAELGIGRVLVPRDSAVFAAVGMLLADVRQDSIRALPGHVEELEPSTIARVADELAAEAVARLESEGFQEEDVVLSAGCDMRYGGQFHEVLIPASLETMREGDLADAVRRFDVEHERLYGWSDSATGVELVNIRITAEVRTPKPVRPRLNGTARGARDARRTVLLPETRSFAPVDVLQGEALSAGDEREGPLLIELPTTSVVVPESFSVAVTGHGDFLMLNRAAAVG